MESNVEIESMRSQVGVSWGILTKQTISEGAMSLGACRELSYRQWNTNADRAGMLDIEFLVFSPQRTEQDAGGGPRPYIIWDPFE